MNTTIRALRCSKGEERRVVPRTLLTSVLLVSAVMAGCSVKPTTVIPANTKTEQPTQTQEAVKPAKTEAFEPSARTNTAYLSPAAQELVTKAKRYSGDGDTASALRYLERAQRISPRAPQVYLAMAEVRKQQGRNSQARQLANKGLSLVGDDEALKKAIEFFLNTL